MLAPTQLTGPMTSAAQDTGEGTTDAGGPPADVYTHGHHESVLRSHRWRTAENSAGYLLPALRSGMRLLDVGCGPGTITVNLARLLEPGRVVGVDTSADVIEVARSAAGESGLGNLTFEIGDAYALPFADSSFDVVHAHQVLQHLTDPVAALRELRRVARPGGLVAVRDSDYAGKIWHPASPGLDDWLDLYHQVTTANHAEADAGRRLLSWALAAGFDAEAVAPSASVWCFATPQDRGWWSDLWSVRAVASDFATQALAYGLADRDRLEAISRAWKQWGAQPDGWLMIPHGELLARV